MKKLLLILLALVMCFSVCACGDTIQSDNENSNDPTSETNDNAPTVLRIGEKATTDMVEFILNESQFADLVGLKSDNWLQPYHGVGGMGPGKGNVFIWFSYTVKNISNSEMSAYDVNNIVVNYNNEQIYDDGVFSSGYNTASVKQIANNTNLESIPVNTSKYYYGYITCEEIVKTDTKSPLSLNVSLPSSSGDIMFVYTLDISSGSDTSEEALYISECLNNAADDLGLVAICAGNVSLSGSRAYSEEAIQRMLSCLDEVDIEYAKANLPNTAKNIPIIKDRIDEICDYLIDMGITNSAKNKEKIRQMAKETVSMIEKLLSTELKAYN